MDRYHHLSLKPLTWRRYLSGMLCRLGRAANRNEPRRRNVTGAFLSSLSHITKIFGLDHQAAIHIYGVLTYHGDKKREAAEGYLDADVAKTPTLGPRGRND
jgi:hypothetical protein